MYLQFPNNSWIIMKELFDNHVLEIIELKINNSYIK